jgi:hypothetical protein
MNKETQKKLTKDFPKSVVKKAPQGKFGDYVPHHIYTQRLVDVIGGGYDFTFEETRDKTGAIIGAKCRLYIKSTDQTIEEVGDVDVNAVKRNITESEILKLAVSDGIKRCCMRLGIGLELWTGGVTEEEHYAEVQTSKPKMTKDKEDIKVLEKAKKDFAKDVEEQPNNAQQLNTFMTATVSDEVVKAVIKRDVYRDVVSKGFPEEVEDWDDKQIEIFKDLVFETQQVDSTKTDVEIVEEVFGEIKDLTKNCPDCGKSEYIEDNRKKKQDEPDKYGKIPSWTCSNYKEKNGCGWKAWGDTDCPTEWL